MNIYRPPSGKVDEAVKILQDTCSDFPQNAELYIVGDFNIDASKINSPSSTAMRNFENTYNLSQLIDNNTRTTNKSSSIIDHIYTNSNVVSSHGVLNINISDHMPIFVIRKKMKEPCSVTTFECRKLEHFNEEFYKEKLLESDWSRLFDSNDPTDGWEIMIKTIRNVLDQHYPIKLYKNVPTKAKWITNEIFELMRNRDNIYKEARLLKTPELWNEAKKLRNIVSDTCKKAKRDFIHSNIMNNRENPQKFWGEISKVWDNSKDKIKTDISLTDPTDGNLKEGIRVGNIFNEFFSKVGISIQNSMTELNNDESKMLKTAMIKNQENSDAHNHQSFALRQITHDQLDRVVSKIEMHKNSGIKNVSTHLLKISYKIVLPQLLHIFNKSIMNGAFPQAWKTAIVTPLYKNGLRTDPQNYRPIVCLPLPGKLIEKLIHGQYYAYLEDNKLINVSQFGFRKK